MKNRIVNKIIKSEMVEWQKIKWFQPKDLKKTQKHLIEKLKNSLIKNGFSMPFTVWQKGKDLLILDGHYRFNTMMEMIKDGVEIPEKLPANFIQCKNDNEAKKIVLLYNSHYAEMNNDTLYGFISDMAIDEITTEFNIIGNDINDLIIQNTDFSKMETEPVKEELNKLEKLKEQRKLSREKFASVDDSENYLIITFNTREEKEKFLEENYIDKDTRYINGNKFNEIFNRR